MQSPIDRRRFLSQLVAVSVGGAPFRQVDRGSRGAPPRPISRPELPPRVVGLRSLGGDFRFDPPGLLVEPATRLVWLNMGDFHTATAFHPDNAALVGGDLPLRIPEAAEPWHSGMLGLTAGTRFEHPFIEPGVYDYFCQPHYAFGMVGRIVVESARGGPGTTRADGLTAVVRENLPAVEMIIGPRGRGWEWASRLNGVLLTRANGGDAAAPARATQRGIAADDELASWVGSPGTRSELAARVDRFVGSVVSMADYEDLIRRADHVKELL